MTCLLAHGGRLPVGMAAGLSLHFVALQGSKRTKKPTNVVRFHPGFQSTMRLLLCCMVCCNENKVLQRRHRARAGNKGKCSMQNIHLLVLHEAFDFVVGVAVAVWVELLVLDHALLQRSI